MKQVLTGYRKKEEQLKNFTHWYLIDASGLVLGRLASFIAKILMGKEDPTYTPHLTGCKHLIVVSASDLKFTGNKIEKKFYYHHSGYPGGIKKISLGDLIKKDARLPLLYAVKGMLPKNKLASQMLSQLKVYSGAEHPHVAQKIKKIDFNSKFFYINA